MTLTSIRNLPAVGEVFAAASNRDLEARLIGILINQPAAFRHTVARVTAADFSDPVLAELFAGIAARVEAGRAINGAALRDLVLPFDDELRPVGGALEYLSELQSAAAGALPVEARSLADDIAALARRRRMAEAALDLLERAATEPDASGAISTSIATLEGLCGLARSRNRREALADIAAEQDRPRVLHSTGLPALDRAMAGGLEPGRTYGLAGDAKAGKSALAVTISGALDAAGVKHAYVAAEMGSREIEARKIGAALSVNPLIAMRGAGDDAMKRRIADLAVTAPDFTEYFDVPGCTFERLKECVYSAVHRKKSAGIIVDYWQLITGRQARTTEEEHLRLVAEWLASAAKRLNIWVFILAQLNAEGTETAHSKLGLVRNVDQMFHLRTPDENQPWRWMELKESRISGRCSIGSPDRPSFQLVSPTHVFRDLSAR